MIQPSQFHDRTVAVLGLGKSGLAAALALLAAGVRVRAWDDNEATRADAVTRGIPVVDPSELNWADVAALVQAPGIPHRFPRPHAASVLARDAGVPIIGDVELLLGADRAARVVAITGTNGKSTTTALIAHILRAAGRPLEVGGNLGQPVMGFVPQGTNGTYVLELSSYQLELTPSLHADTAVLLNITPDHLDRHGGMEGYVAAKKMIFAAQTDRDTAVIGVDDDVCANLAQHLQRRPDSPRVIPVSVRREIPGGVWLRDHYLIDDIDGQSVLAVDLDAAKALPGTHNAQNAAAAYAVARAEGVAPQIIAQAIRSFPGLAHRQERIAEVRGVLYVNDSKATNADAAERALVCYENLHWIIGGVAKTGGITSLVPLLKRVKHAYLIGEATDYFATTLSEAKVPFSRCGDLTKAVASAAIGARPGDVVLLSPACASFDQYSNFEARGEHFRHLVEGLAGKGRGAA